MNNFINCSKKLILVKDMSEHIDFNLIDQQFSNLNFVPNVENNISTDMNFFNKEIFQDTKRILETECENFITNAYGIRDFTNLKMTESWGNLTHPNESHHIHTHPFSIVSGVLYLDNNPDNFNLHLEYAVEEVPYFIEHQTTYLPVSRLIESAGVSPSTTNNLKNHLILFLSNTGHYVKTVDNFIDRRTIAFNTFWSGLTGVANAKLGSIKF